jgi:hypothetical protein
MDDWGIAADLLCYQEYDEEYQKISIGSSWMPPLLSKIMLYVNSTSKH